MRFKLLLYYTGSLQEVAVIRAPLGQYQTEKSQQRKYNNGFKFKKYHYINLRNDLISQSFIDRH